MSSSEPHRVGLCVYKAASSNHFEVNKARELYFCVFLMRITDTDLDGESVSEWMTHYEAPASPKDAQWGCLCLFCSVFSIDSPLTVFTDSLATGAARARACTRAFHRHRRTRTKGLSVKTVTRAPVLRACVRACAPQIGRERAPRCWDLNSRVASQYASLWVSGFKAHIPS